MEEWLIIYNEIAGMDFYGEPFTIRKREFYSHPGEFECLVLPKLSNIQTGENIR